MMLPKVAFREFFTETGTERKYSKHLLLSEKRTFLLPCLRTEAGDANPTENVHGLVVGE
jgi:hypothetical protein